MTPEERFNRLEENFNILSQLLIDTKALSERVQAQTEYMYSRTQNLEERTDRLEALSKYVAENTRMLIELARDHDERMWAKRTIEDGKRRPNWTSKCMTKSEAKIAVLADIQLRWEGRRGSPDEG